jgi:micrococcal nuclease
MKKLILLLFATIGLAGCEIEYGKTVNYAPTKVEVARTESTDEFSEYTKTTVERIVDGDTIIVKQPFTKEATIRLILINTKESVGEFKDNPEPFGVEASDFTKMLVENKEVWLEYDIDDTDPYGRTLAYVWLKDVVYSYDGFEYNEPAITLNELLLRHGLAHVAVYEPNVKYKEHFYSVENVAKKLKIGIWSN